MGCFRTKLFSNAGYAAKSQNKSFEILQAYNLHISAPDQIKEKSNKMFFFKIIFVWSNFRY